MEEFKYGGTNITAFRLVDPDGPEVSKAVREWNLNEGKNKKDGVPLVSTSIFLNQCLSVCVPL